MDALGLAIASNPTCAPAHLLLAAALALTGEDAAARVAMADFQSAEPVTTIDALARRSAVPFDGTDPFYKGRNERALDGLRRQPRRAIAQRPVVPLARAPRGRLRRSRAQVRT